VGDRPVEEEVEGGGVDVTRGRPSGVRAMKVRRTGMVLRYCRGWISAGWRWRWGGGGASMDGRRGVCALCVNCGQLRIQIAKY